jgi:O-acetyl-ADP-ribose deacetylase
MVTGRILLEQTAPEGQAIRLVQGDLTLEAVDAIVNAANPHLQHGGGIAGAVVRRGGFSIQQESDEWIRKHGPVSHAEPAYTRAGSLPCRYVIHAVGPVWGQSSPEQADADLRAAVSGSLHLASELNLASIALPAISTGIFGFPKQRAATVILSAVWDFFAEQPSTNLREVHLVVFDQPTLEAFQQAWKDVYK